MELQANSLVIRRKAHEAFIDTQRSGNEGLFGEFTLQNGALVDSPSHYEKLLPLLQQYLTRDTRFKWADSPSQREWEALFEDVATAESKAAASDNGPFDIFDRMMLRVGKHADTIDPWINLIPDDFGLCVVKSGFALLLDYARKHSDTRQEIFDAFISLRNILGDASSKGIHFQTDPNVSRCAADVYEAIVDSIQELLILVKTQKKSKWPLKTRKKDQSRDVPGILKEANGRAKALLVTVDNCRDATIKKTGEDASQVLDEVQFIGWKAIEIREAVSNIDKRQDMQMLTLESVQRTQNVMVDLANKIRANYEDNFREHYKKFQVTLTRLESLLRQQETGIVSGFDVSVREERSLAEVSLDRLFKILAAPDPNAILPAQSPLKFEVLNVRTAELHTVLTSTSKFGPRAQSQAQLILHQDRFFDWMGRSNSDMILVEGNIQEFARSAISPLSSLCANLCLTLGNMEPGCVIIQFYCGLHTSWHQDDWHGPIGMLRLLSLQLLMSLVESGRFDLSFLNSRRYCQGLEHHNLEKLCDLLQDLLQQFNAGSKVYCIIDGVSMYDVDYKGIFTALKVVMRRIQDMVTDENMRPNFKVLMTVPFRSSLRLREMTDDDFYLSLASRTMGSRGLSENSVSFAISQPSALLRNASHSEQQDDPSDSAGEDYDDE